MATFAGTLTACNGGTMFWSQLGASQYVCFYCDPDNHAAWGYLYDYTTGVYPSMYDSNKLNDPATWARACRPCDFSSHQWNL